MNEIGHRQSLGIGQLDFVLGRIPARIDARQFTISGVLTEEVDLLIHQSHPLANAERLTMSDLVHFPWVMQAPGAPMRQALEGVFVAQGAPIPSNIVNTTSLLVMIAMLAASNAIAPMSRELSELLCRHTTGSGVTRLDVRQEISVAPYHLISLAGKRMSPVATRMRDLVAREFDSRRRG